MAPDTSRPPKSAVMEQPGELPSPSSDSAGAPGRRLPGQGAQAVRKRVTSSRLTHSRQPLGMDYEREAVAVLSSFELWRRGILTLPLSPQGLPKPDCIPAQPHTIIRESTLCPANNLKRSRAQAQCSTYQPDRIDQPCNICFFICKMGMVTLAPHSAQWYWVSLINVRVLEIGKYHVEVGTGSWINGLLGHRVKTRLLGLKCLESMPCPPLYPFIPHPLPHLASLSSSDRLFSLPLGLRGSKLFPQPSTLFLCLPKSS